MLKSHRVPPPESPNAPSTFPSCNVFSLFRLSVLQTSLRASLVAQMVKNLPTVQEIQVQSLGQEDPLEKEMGTHSGISCLENAMDRGVWRAIVHGVIRSWT